MFRKQRGVLVVFLFLCCLQIVIAYPNINITSPENRTYNNATILVNITADGNDTIWFYNGTDNETYSVSKEITFTEGSHTLTAWTNDTDGNTNETNVTFIVDTISPNITINSPTNITYNTSEISFNVTLTEKGTCEFSLDEEANKTSMNSSDNETFDSINSSLSDGNYTAIFYCNDSAGNIKIENISFKIDTIYPQIFFSNDTDNISIISLNYFVINVTVEEDNINYTQITIYNSSGELENSTNGTYLNYTVPSDGSYYFNATTYDMAGFINSTETRNITIDTTPPQIYFDNQTDNGTIIGRNYMIINITVIEANINYTQIEIYNSSYDLINITNGTFMNYTVPSEGTYYVNATTYDLTGRYNNTETINVTLIIVELNMTFDSPSDMGNINRQYILINTTANKQNVINLTIELYNSNNSLINSTTFFNYTAFVNISNLSDDTYYYNVTAYDTLERAGYSTTQNVTINTNFPDISFSIPTDFGNFLNRDYIVINTTTTGENITNVTLNIYDSIGNLINSTQYMQAGIAYNLSNLSEGTYYFNATVTNIWNYSDMTETRNITIDLTVPSLIIENDTDTGIIINRDSVIINVSSYDTYLENMTINIYDINDSLIYNITSVNNNITLNYTLSEGFYYFNATAYDSAGNTNTTETRNITIDFSNPTIEFVSPSENSTTITKNYIVINLSSYDVFLNNITIYLYNLNDTLLTINTTYADNLFVNFTNLSDGLYHINATAYDDFNHTNSTTTLNITINTTVPVITPPPSSGGGSGSGGSASSGGIGGGAAAPTNNSDVNRTSFTQYWPNIINGSRTINIDKTGMPLMQITIITNNNSNVANTFTVVAQSENPYNKNNLSAAIYTFIVFDTSLADRYVNNLTFRFKVQKKWLSQNNLTADNITVYDYDNNSWNNNSVSKYSEDTGYVYYVSNSPKLSNLAIAGPLRPTICLIKEDISYNGSNQTEMESFAVNNTELTIEQKGFLSRSWNTVAAKTNKILDGITSSKEAKSVIVVVISSILTLILGIVTGILVYKNAIKPRRMRRMYNKQIIGRIMPYREEPPMQAQETIIVQAKTDKMPPEIKVAPDPEFNVRKITELLMQCQYALDNGKLEEADQFYSQAKSIYFNSNLDYEHKAKVYDKIISLHGRLAKKS